MAFRRYPSLRSVAASLLFAALVLFGVWFSAEERRLLKDPWKGTATLRTRLGHISVEIDPVHSASLPFDFRAVTAESAEALACALSSINKAAPDRQSFRYRWPEFRWRIIALSDDAPQLNDLPACQPAWMSPPATVYVVPSRLTGRCFRQRKFPHQGSRGYLRSVLIHEMAHPLEFVAAGNGYHQQSLFREGFATWLEVFALACINPEAGKRLRDETLSRAQQTLEPGWEFTGKPQDYARAAMYFQVLIERFGLEGLVRLYDAVYSGQHSWEESLKTVSGWDRAAWDEAVRDSLGQGFASEQDAERRKP